MNTSFALNNISVGLPRLEKPQGLVNLQNSIDRLGFEYLMWQQEHPILNTLTQVAGGLLLVAALKATPSPENLGHQFQHLTQNLGSFFNNPQTPSLPMGGFNEQIAQATQQPCGIADTLTIHSGDTFFSTVRNAIKAQGVTDPDEIRRIYNEIVAFNADNIKNPAVVAADTVVKIPDFVGCEPNQPVAIATQAMSAGTTEQVFADTLNTTGTSTTSAELSGDGKADLMPLIAIPIVGGIIALIGGMAIRRRNNNQS